MTDKTDVNYFFMPYNCTLCFLICVLSCIQKNKKHWEVASGGVFCGHLSIEQSASLCVRTTASQTTQITEEVKNAALNLVCCGSGP